MSFALLAFAVALVRPADAENALLTIDMTVEQFTQKVEYRHDETLAVVERLMRNDTHAFDLFYHALFTCYEPRANQSYTCSICNFGVPGSEEMLPLRSLRHPWVTQTFKRDASAFKPAPNHPDLHKMLQAAAVDTLYVVGINTNWCVMATVMDALALGYKVFPVRDAMSTVDGETAHRRGLDAMDLAMQYHWPGSRIINSSEIGTSVDGRARLEVV